MKLGHDGPWVFSDDGRQIIGVRNADGTTTMFDAVPVDYPPAGGIPENDLAVAVRTKLNAVGTAGVDSTARADAAAALLTAESAIDVANAADDKADQALAAITPAGVATAIANMSEAERRSTTILLEKTKGHFIPEGAYGDAYASKLGAINVAQSKITDADYTFTSADVGKPVYFDNWSGPYTITSISSGSAVLSKAPPGWMDFTGSNYQLWSMGHDDTAAVRAAVAEAATYNGKVAETSVGGSRAFQAGGGVVDLIARYCVSQPIPGVRAAIILPRRVTIQAAGGPGFGRAGLMAVSGMNGGSYNGFVGHMIANAGNTSYTDFVDAHSLSLWGLKDMHPDQLDGVNFDIPGSAATMAAIDAFNRIERCWISEFKRDAVRWSGKGETKIITTHGVGCGGVGLNLITQDDCEVVSCNWGGNTKTGLRIYAGGAINVNGGKSYYNGIGGGTDPEASANLFLGGDHMNHGLNFINGLQLQESWGSSAVVKSAYNTFTGVQFLDPGREGNMGSYVSGARPAVIAGVHLAGPWAYGNDFGGGCLVSGSVGLYTATPWSPGAHAVYVDSWDATNGGPQDNTGSIRTRRQVAIGSAGGNTVGMPFGSGKSKVHGDGAGKNGQLLVDGVAVA